MMKEPTVGLHSVIKNSYATKKAKTLQGYELDNELSDHNQQVYYNPQNRKLLYSVTGTHNISDVGTDFYLAGGHLKDTNRYKKAHKGLRDAKSKYNVNSATVTGHSLGGSIAGYIASDGDNVVTLDKGATIGQKIRKNENAFRISGDAVSAFNKFTPGMKTLQNPNDTKRGIVNRLYHAATRGNILARAKEALDAHSVDHIKDFGIDVAHAQGSSI